MVLSYVRYDSDLSTSLIVGAQFVYVAASEALRWWRRRDDGADAQQRIDRRPMLAIGTNRLDVTNGVVDAIYVHHDRVDRCDRCDGVDDDDRFWAHHEASEGIAVDNNSNRIDVTYEAKGVLKSETIVHTIWVDGSWLQQKQKNEQEVSDDTVTDAVDVVCTLNEQDQCDQQKQEHKTSNLRTVDKHFNCVGVTDVHDDRNQLCDRCDEVDDQFLQLHTTEQQASECRSMLHLIA